MKFFVLVVCIGIASCHPRPYRLKRESSSKSPGTSSTSPTDSSTSTTAAPETSSNSFGIGAAAGIGGVGSSAGIGNFQADTKKNPFLPFGAFAGLNLGQGGRIGAGCSGLSCGFQLGDFVFATPQLLGIGQNFGATTGNGKNTSGGNNSNSIENQVKNAISRADTQNSNTNSTGEQLPTVGPTVLTRFRPDQNIRNDIRNIFRDMFRGFTDALSGFFQVPSQQPKTIFSFKPLEDKSNLANNVTTTTAKPSQDPDSENIVDVKKAL